MYSSLSFLLPFGLFILQLGFASAGNTTILYNGFKSANLIVDGMASITSDGLLRLTNEKEQETGHAFYRDPIPFKQSKNGSVLSFSTTFVFCIRSKYPDLAGQGLAFVIAPNSSLPHSLAKPYLGLFNRTNNGKESNHVVAVEIDIIRDPELNETESNHVGIDINRIESVKAVPARYYFNATSYDRIDLYNSQPVQVWVEYDASKMQMEVTLSPTNMTKPTIPLLTLENANLSSILYEDMFVGFSSGTGTIITSHYILGWSFALNTTAPPLNISSLIDCRTPPPPPPSKSPSKIVVIGIPVISALVIIIVICLGVIYTIQRKKKFSEELEDWESEYGPHRFKYKDLYVATKGFQDKELVGTGGFGKVYKGVLPRSETEVAVKKVSHDSKQGMREFVAEIASMGRVRHRNLVQLLGYCRRKGELLLVYEYMPNGSLDKYLHQSDNPDLILNWSQRFSIIKGVASGLLYLHEGWEQVVVHRDIKSSNVLLGSELDARLGDFGLARLHDHDSDPQTTHVMGTLGYIAPEHSRTGRATRRSDVFAFGAFLLEVATGRRPIDLLAPGEDCILVNRVFRSWKAGYILRVVDSNLKGEYVVEEVEMVLKLGLLCSNMEPEERPTMGNVVEYLNGVVPIPDLEGLELGPGGLARRLGFKDFPVSYTSSTFNTMFTRSGSITESQLVAWYPQDFWLHLKVAKAASGKGRIWPQTSLFCCSC